MLVKMKDYDYGRKWPEGMLQIHKELYGYLMCDKQRGFATKTEHALNIMRIQWPWREDSPDIEWERDGVLNESFLAVVHDLCTEKDLCIMGPASAGKTYPCSAMVLVDWWAAPHRTSSLICSTTLGASEDRIWGKVRRLFNRATYKFGTMVDHKHMIVFGQWATDKAAEREPDNAIKFVAIEKGAEGRKALETMRGRKNARVRVWVDELAEMANGVLDIRMNLGSNDDFQYRGMGNFSGPHDPLGEMGRPDDPLGYDSIAHLYQEKRPFYRWKTRTGSCVFIRSDCNPNYVHGRIIFPYLMTPDKERTITAASYGNTQSLEYYRNLVGWPSSAVQGGTILTPEEISMSTKSSKGILWKPPGPIPIAALDVGLVHGGDPSVARFALLGKEFHTGKMSLVFGDEVRIIPNINEIYEDGVAKRFIEECKKRKVNPRRVGVDVSGDGGKIIAAIIREWIRTDPYATDIYPISSLGKATDRKFGEHDNRKCSEICDRRVTEYWWAIRRAVLGGNVYDLDVTSDMCQQWCQRLYEMYGNDMVKLEKKEDFADRIKKSPNEGDVGSYVIEMARRNGFDISIPDPETEQPVNWRDKDHDDSSTLEDWLSPAINDRAPSMAFGRSSRNDGASRFGESGASSRAHTRGRGRM